MFSVSKPERAYGKRKSVTEKGTTLMSFHKIAPVKKTRKPGAKRPPHTGRRPSRSTSPAAVRSATRPARTADRRS